MLGRRVIVLCLAPAVFGVVAAAVVPAAAGCLFRESGPRPVTLVTVRGEVAALAQDAGRITWIDGKRDGDGNLSDAQVRLRTLSTGVQQTLGNANLWGDSGLQDQTFSDPPALPLALAGASVAWGGFDAASNSGYGGVATAKPAQRPRTVQRLVWEHWFWGDYLTGVAGDRSTLLYSTVTVTHRPDDDDECARGPCVFRVTKGAVERIMGRSMAPLPGSPPSVAIAVSGDRVALVPAGLRPHRCASDCAGASFSAAPAAEPDGRVEIRDALTGRLVTQFAPAGTVRAVALSGHTAAVLVRKGRSKRIERYDAATGRLQGRTSVPASTADSLTASDRTIVFRTGTRISLLDSATGKASLLTIAGSTPVGLSIDGRRVAWAENGVLPRIFAITLPR